MGSIRNAYMDARVWAAGKYATDADFEDPKCKQCGKTVHDCQPTFPDFCRRKCEKDYKRSKRAELETKP